MLEDTRQRALGKATLTFAYFFLIDSTHKATLTLRQNQLRFKYMLVLKLELDK